MNALIPESWRAGATFSACGVYRYSLWRQWGAGPLLLWVMLNPSTADERHNDPSVARCCRRSQTLGYGGLFVVNLFALRSTDPPALYRHPAPVGPRNDQTIATLAALSEGPCGVLCAWGNHGAYLGRGEVVLAMLRRAGAEPWVLTVTGAGQPGHPLYVGYGVEPAPLAGLEQPRRMA